LYSRSVASKFVGR
jgi:hypothetical protein